MRTSIVVSVAATLLSVPQAFTVSANIQADHTRRLTGFHRAVQTYVGLRRALEVGLPALEVSSDAEQIDRAVDALANAIRTARAGALPGDVFTKEGGSVIRARISTALSRDGYEPALLLRAMAEDDEGGWPPLTVNGSFPWMAGNAMWMSVLAELPALPDELEYRFVGRELVLLDIDAGLVVDVLPAALGPEQSGS